MRTYQNVYSASFQWKQPLSESNVNDAHLVLLFGSTELIKNKMQLKEIRDQFQNAIVIGCSTAGEIHGTEVLDDTIVLTAVAFDKTSIKAEWVTIDDAKESYAVGEQLASKIPHEDLAHLFLISDGLNVNGSELVKGLASHIPENVAITGGLSGDAARFEETYVVFNDEVKRNAVLALGFYGEALNVGYASLGGWDPFGPQRVVTKSEDNVLYELDGKSALSLYKEYLGEHASGLPATGLLFPLSLSKKDDAQGVVRTILGVDEENQSMTFAGNIDEGALAQLMKANFDRLIDGAVGAADNSIKEIGQDGELAILISCVGRKLILKDRIEEETEGVRSVVGDKPVLTGFYSYGEVSPFLSHAKCELHNQTMTISIFSEK